MPPSLLSTRTRKSEPLATTMNRFSAGGFFTIIALAPLPFGSADQASVSFWCLALALALAFCDPGPLPLAKKIIIAGVLSLLGVFIAAALLQIASPPLLGDVDAIWMTAKDLIGEPINSSIAVARWAPLYSLGPVFACMLSLLLGVLLGSDSRRAHRILMVFAWSGAAYAIYGIVSALLEPSMILWQEREYYVGNVIGTFTYRNTAAAYFGSCTIVWVLMLCEAIQTHLPRHQFTWKQFSRNILFEARLDVILSFTGFFLCLAALLMTTSRAGTLISLIASVIAVAIYFRREFAKKNFVIVVGSCLVLAVLQLFAGSLSQRFEASGFSDALRLATYKATLRLIAEHPWLGAGLGNFPWVFPEYRGSYPSMFGVWQMAHSTPLELAAEMGVPIAALTGIGWVCILAILIRGILRRRRDMKIPLTAAAIALLALVHSSIDFALQIPGYAIVAMAVIGTGISQSFGSKSADF